MIDRTMHKTPAEAGAILGVAAATIYNYINGGSPLRGS